MSDIGSTKNRQPAQTIDLGDGEFADLRGVVAERLGCAERTVARPFRKSTIYVAGHAYVLRNASQEELRARDHYGPKPQRARRGGVAA